MKKTLQNFKCTYYTFMCIRIVTLGVVITAFRFAYKVNGLRNMQILIMILFLILGLLTDTAKRTVEMIHALENPEPNKMYEWKDDLIKIVFISTDYSMNSIALLLNLGVWIVYLLKI